jgi:hypothetical protein
MDDARSALMPKKMQAKQMQAKLAGTRP